VRVWVAREVAEKLPAAPWLELVTPPELSGRLPERRLWLRRFPERARGCALVFAPGGSPPYRFHRLVTMSQNMLPFEWSERRRYGLSREGLRLAVLAYVQRRAFERADGVLFLTEYARRVVTRHARIRGATRIVPHGVNEAFLAAPRPQRPLAACSERAPLRILYVSIIDVYKHQDQVARAAAQLRAGGLPVAVRFVGPAYPPALARLERVRRALDPRGEFLQVAGPLPYEALPHAYAESDLCVFASSCENGPNVLLEGMAAAMPIACSDRGPMPEVLGDAGVYFDPESAASIAVAIERLARDPLLRARLAALARGRVEGATWTRCAHDTFAFLREVAGA
jgi:glycosyltransferase involved in cell wall biosynthesis